MLVIAHRGLMQGPSTLLQNHPDQICKALSAGFGAEIDVWYKSGQWWLGHDSAEHLSSWEFISQDNLWIHCKNLPAFFELRAANGNYNYFWHESDMVVRTSQDYIWTYFGKPQTQSLYSICVMPEVNYNWDEIATMVNSGQWLGFCTDYPEKIAGLVK